MSDFSEAYIQLCRNLELPKAPMAGDFYFEPLTGKTAVCTDGSGMCYLGGGFSSPIGSEWVWLPREGDLLDLLEAEGGHKVEIIGMDDHSYVCTLSRHGGPGQSLTYEAAADDAKLALGRLYAAVKGVES